MFARFPKTVFVALTLAPPLSAAPDGVVGSVERQAGGHSGMTYHLITVSEVEGKKSSGKPKGLVVVLPGGDGSAAFNPFIKNLAKFGIGASYLVAQPVAPRWRKEQKVVWPTAVNVVPGMEFTTEAFIEAVVKDVAEAHAIDRGRIFTLSWSSGGPAAYAASMTEGTSIKGCYVAMSVFREHWCPPLKRAAGKAYFIDHSPEDKVCGFEMARRAESLLRENGAKTKLVTYEGGHGWHGDVFGRVNMGIAWLEKAVR
jgi:predicted esterase